MMTTETHKETHGFQTEVKQLLHLMIHSLYSNKEIFLRELISNASDACDKLRFQSISDSSLLEDDPELFIGIEADAASRVVTVTDNGIGMSRQEVVEQLGTIAKSGTAQFLEQLSGDQRKDSGLIGQFGVGFYSSFIVADRVEVLTRRAGDKTSEGVRWVSDGRGEFSVETIDRPRRGTEVKVHLKPTEDEFADSMRLRHLARHYSDHIAFPVRMRKTEPDAEAESTETVNIAQALWTRPRQEISEEEYREFYTHISHDSIEPLLWSHNRVEGKHEYTSLLYLPGGAPFDLWNRELPRGLKLYVQRVFIMDDATQFLPLYLRFVRGIVDSNDLSLNVSREMLQQDAAVRAIRGALTKRVLGMIEQLSQDGEKYGRFWKEFGTVVKEGAIEDTVNRDKIMPLLRFSSTHTDSENQDQTLRDYVGRMKKGQSKIYYVAADSHNAAKTSAHLEVFRKKGVEALLLSDRIDEWLMQQVGEFDGKVFQDVARGQLELTEVETAADRRKLEEAQKEYEGLTARAKEVLADKVEDVRVSERLTESAACLVVGEHDVGSQMRRIMEALGQPIPASKPYLELNPDHPLITRLAAIEDDQRFEDLALIVFDQAVLAEGGVLPDPPAYIRRLNRLLVELSGA